MPGKKADQPPLKPEEIDITPDMVESGYLGSSCVEALDYFQNLFRIKSIVRARSVERGKTEAPGPVPGLPNCANNRPFPRDNRAVLAPVEAEGFYLSPGQTLDRTHLHEEFIHTRLEGFRFCRQGLGRLGNACDDVPGLLRGIGDARDIFRDLLGRG